MRRIRLALLAALPAFLGCASKPSPPPEKPADVMTAMGLFMLMASDQSREPGGKRIMEVAISPACFDVVASIRQFRATQGKWPEPSEVPLPPGAGLTHVVVAARPNEAEIEIMSENRAVLKCLIQADGTVYFAPAVDKLMGVLRSATSRGPDLPIIVPPPNIKK